jgi:hypothetical protein
MEFNRTEQKTIGKSPDREDYEIYEGSGKLMELSFFENSDRFEIYIQNIKDGERVDGETTELFKLMVKKMQEKADELGRPVQLVLDPVVPVIKDWARTQASTVLGGWDSVSSNESLFKKTIHPRVVVE